MTANFSRVGPSAENTFVAEKLREVGDLLEQQAATQFRVRAYRDAASYVATLPQPIRTIYQENGRRGLEDLPTIGVSISRAIAELLDTGALGILERLRGTTDPEKLFQTIPMIGPSLARAIHETLHIDTLEALETVALDGRLATVEGIGQRRIDSIRHSLNDMLARRRPAQLHTNSEAPPIADILAIDQEYRETADTLPVITPRRFNEAGKDKIPILHIERGKWQFTALFSNSASAHRYGKTRDWVVIYYEHNGHFDGQCTVVTQYSGSLQGRRVVRGREKECSEFYGARRQ